MSDSLFYLVVAVLAGFYLVRGIRHRRRLLRQMPEAARGARIGPVPGYSRLGGRNVQWAPDEAAPPGLGQTWEPICMETIHAGRRSRLVLSLRQVDEMESTAKFNIMKTLAQRLARRTGALVVAVQFGGDSNAVDPDAILILARDGRGWTGTSTNAAVTARLPGHDDFRMEARDTGP